MWFFDNTIYGEYSRFAFFFFFFFFFFFLFFFVFFFFFFVFFFFVLLIPGGHVCLSCRPSASRPTIPRQQRTRRGQSVGGVSR